MKTKIIAQNTEHLEFLIAEEIKLYGNKCDLNHVDTSLITDMSTLFQDLKFNGVISQWDVSQVTDMSYLFYNSQFNGDISNWNVSSVTNMEGMFESSQFNGNISGWDVSSVKDMSYLLFDSVFNGDLHHWNISNVINMEDILYDCPCEKTWWAIEDNEQRKIAIDNYNLMQKLDNKLTNKDNKQLKKSKI